MKTIVFLSVLSIITATCYAQADLKPLPSSKMGLGFQFSGSSLLLISWQSPDLNSYGRAWRIEPMIGFTSSDNEVNSNDYSTSMSLTLGLGAYLHWRVRYPFDNLYFTAGPRVTVTGYRSTYEYTYDTIKHSSQYLSTSLALIAGPEYALDSKEHFSIAGFISYAATIRGRAKYEPATTTSAWNFSTATSTGIVLRYYFM